MQFLNDMFPAFLSKYGAKVVDDDVMTEITITYTSKNDPNQDFLDDFAEEFQSNIHKCLVDPEWSNVTFKKVIPSLDIKFDSMEFKATLQTIKISQKETPKDLTFKYDFTFIKKQDKEIDTYIATYLKHKEEDEDGKSQLVMYDVEVRND